MGDGEFVGGGSVTWTVTNSDGESGGGDKEKVHGKDKDPKGPGGMFRVTVNGELAVMVPLLIGIVWLGLYPAPVLKRMEASTNRYLEVIRPHRSGADPAVKLGASVEVRP